MTPANLRDARRKLGLSCYEMGEALGIAGTVESQGGRVRDMESGRRQISGPVARLTLALLDGWTLGTPMDIRAVKRMTGVVSGLLLESEAAAKRCVEMQRRGSTDDALIESGRATGVARAANVMAAALGELVE